MDTKPTVYSLGEQGVDLNYNDGGFLEFWCIGRLHQENENKALFRTMWLAHSVLEATIHEL